MISMNPIAILGGLVLLFFAPGFFLLHAIFPGRRYFGPFHPLAMPLLSVVASLVALVLVGSALGFSGLFFGSQTGPPYIEASLGALSVALFAVAWWRGAFPLLGRAPRKEYASFQERGEPEEITLLRDLRLEGERLRKEAARVRKRARASRDRGVRSALTEAAEDLERERDAVAKRAEDLERRAGERRYGTLPDPRFRVMRPPK